jgi:single-strand DNA-binding protein
MLRVICLGHLGADPEEHYTPKRVPMAQFRVAVNQVHTGPAGERQETTEWVRVRAMGPLAERAQRLSKGDRVLVIGPLTVSHYQSREGQPRTSLEVWADEVTGVSPRPPGRTREPEAEREAEEADADELPF